MNDLESALRGIKESLSRGESTSFSDWSVIEDQLEGSDVAETINNIQQFVSDNFSFEISPNAEGFVYYGQAIDGSSSECAPIYKIVDDIVNNSSETYGYISSTEAGKLFNDKGFELFLKDIVLRDPNITDENFNTIYNGTNYSGIIELSDNTSAQAFNDFFSENYVSHLKCSNIETLMSGDYMLNCFGRTEFKAILENDAIKTINGIDKNVFAEVFHNAPIGEEMNCVCDVIKLSEVTASEASKFENIYFTARKIGSGGTEVTIYHGETEGATNLVKSLIANEKIVSSSTKSVDEIISLCGDSLSFESRSALEVLSTDGNQYLYRFLSENSEEILSDVGKDSVDIGRFTLTKGNPVVETLADGTKVFREPTSMVTAADAEAAGYTAVKGAHGTIFTKVKDGIVKVFKAETPADGIGAVLIGISTGLVIREASVDCQDGNYKDASEELMSYGLSLLGSTVLAAVAGAASLPGLVAFAVAAAGGFIGSWIGNQIADWLYDSLVIETHNGYTSSVFERKYGFKGCVTNVIEAYNKANGNQNEYLHYLHAYFPYGYDQNADLQTFYRSILDGYWDYLSDERFYNDLSDDELSALVDFYRIINTERGNNSDYDASLDTVSDLLIESSAGRFDLIGKMADIFADDALAFLDFLEMNLNAASDLAKQLKGIISTASEKTSSTVDNITKPYNNNIRKSDFFYYVDKIISLHKLVDNINITVGNSILENEVKKMFFGEVDATRVDLADVYAALLEEYVDLLLDPSFYDGLSSDELNKLSDFMDVIGSKRGDSEHFDTLYDKVDSLLESYHEAEKAVVRIDPLVIDLGKNGFELTSVEDGVHFDMDSNGIAEKTGWVKGDDAFLVLDRNGNGVIDNSGEMFGDRTILQNGEYAASGFEALAEYDSNMDGYINAGDEVFGELKLWQDKNQDGISTEDELHSLSDFGISALSLDYTGINLQDEDSGSLLANLSSVVFDDGTETSIGEFKFEGNKIDTSDRFFDISEDINNLPNVRAIGNVHSLHYAMAMDDTGKIKELVESFVNSDNIDERKGFVEEILYLLCGASDESNDHYSMKMGVALIASGASALIETSGSSITKKLRVLEMFFAERFQGANGSTPNSAAQPILESCFAELVNSYYCELAANGVGKYLSAAYATTETRSDGSKKLNTMLMNVLVKHDLQSHTLKDVQIIDIGLYLMTHDIAALSEYKMSLTAISDAYRELIEENCSTITGTSSNDTLRSSVDNSVISALDGNDTIYGSDNREAMFGGSDDDRLYGRRGDVSYLRETVTALLSSTVKPTKSQLMMHIVMMTEDVLLRTLSLQTVRSGTLMRSKFMRT